MLALRIRSWILLIVMQMRVLSQPFDNGSTSYKTTPETLAKIGRSLELRPRQDYIHRVMVNYCISARWSPICQCLALTSLTVSHPLPKRHNRESVMHQTLIGGFSTHFRTSINISVLSFTVYVSSSYCQRFLASPIASPFQKFELLIELLRPSETI